MKINNINIKNSQVNFAEKIDEIVYVNNQNITKEEFDAIKIFIKSLSQNSIKELFLLHKEAMDEQNENLKSTKIEKIKNFLVTNGLNIVSSISANALFFGIQSLIAN